MTPRFTSGEVAESRRGGPAFALSEIQVSISIYPEEKQLEKAILQSLDLTTPSPAEKLTRLQIKIRLNRIASIMDARTIRKDV